MTSQKHLDECASWTDARTVKFVKFVELFRNYECLGRTNSPQHSDRNKHLEFLDATTAIASELYIHFIDCDFISKSQYGRDLSSADML